jgi:hypothetical protein
MAHRCGYPRVLGCHSARGTVHRSQEAFVRDEVQHDGTIVDHERHSFEAAARDVLLTEAYHAKEQALAGHERARERQRAVDVAALFVEVKARAV